jgi:hypothetical protein
MKGEGGPQGSPLINRHKEKNKQTSIFKAHPQGDLLLKNRQTASG